MKLCRYLAILGVLFSVTFVQASTSDTMDLMGGTALFDSAGQNGWSIGWYGEAWRDSGNAWCGDTIFKDLTKDTIHDTNTVILLIFKTINDTLYKGTDTQKIVSIDTLVPDTTVTIKDSIIDSSKVLKCNPTNYVTDAGGFVEGQKYVNYYYKFRHWYAQLPIVWANWAGLDSSIVLPYKYFLITYKGILPTHQVSMTFFYATWSMSGVIDTTKNTRKVGDGLGILTSSPDWKTVVIKIPDSVCTPGITGVSLNIGNAPNGGGDSLSGVGNLKVARISLIVETNNPVRYTTAPRTVSKDRLHFVPNAAGKVTVSIYSLKGELLHEQIMSVESGRQYSIRSIAQQRSGVNGGAMRIVKIQGAGVSINQKIW